jgi:hypothetical protein
MEAASITDEFAGPAAEGFALRLARPVVAAFFDESRRTPKTPKDRERLKGMGWALQMMVTHPDFPDPDIREAIASRVTLNDIEANAAAMPDAAADQILAEAGLA